MSLLVDSHFLLCPLVPRRYPSLFLIEIKNINSSLVHYLHCSPIDDDDEDHDYAWKSSSVIKPLSIGADLLCSLTGEKTNLIGITPDYEEKMIYDYSPWHSRLLIDSDKRGRVGTKSRYLKFTTRCDFAFSLLKATYRQECLIEIIKLEGDERRSRLFIRGSRKQVMLSQDTSFTCEQL